jgi:hypothetical protein
MYKLASTVARKSAPHQNDSFRESKSCLPLRIICEADYASRSPVSSTLSPDRDARA